MLKNVTLHAAALVLAAGLAAPASAAAPMAPKPASVAQEDASVIEVGHRNCRRCDRGGRHYKRHRNRSNFSLSFSFGSPGYYHAPRYYHAPKVYYHAPVAWTPAWYTYCKTKYRSFNPHTGYYMTHSSGWKLCHYPWTRADAAAPAHRALARPRSIR